MVKQIRSPRVLKQAARVVLLGSAVVGLSALWGCEDSLTGQATKTAVVNSEKAARIEASAGDARPTQTLIDKSADPDFEANYARMKALIAKEADHSTLIKMNTVAEDLAVAEHFLNDAKTKQSLSDQTKSLVQMHLGYNSAQQAQLQLTAMQADLLKLERISSALQNSAIEVTSLSQAIKILQDARDAGMQKIDADLAEAQSNLTKVTQESNEKAQTAKALEDKLNAQRQQSADLNRKGQADMLAATHMRGQASIEAFDAAAKVQPGRCHNQGCGQCAAGAFRRSERCHQSEDYGG